MNQFAERVQALTDVDVLTGMPAQQWADVNASGVVFDDDPAALPNVKYLQQGPPTARNWRNAIGEEYIGTIVEYVGSRPPGR
jgi:hypothetical protein